MSYLRFLTSTKALFHPLAYFIKKILTDFFIILIIIGLHILIGGYLVTGIPKQTLLSPQPLKVRWLTLTASPTKPQIQPTKSVKKIVFTRKNPDQKTSMVTNFHPQKRKSHPVNSQPLKKNSRKIMKPVATKSSHAQFHPTSVPHPTRITKKPIALKSSHEVTSHRSPVATTKPIDSSSFQVIPHLHGNPKPTATQSISSSPIPSWKGPSSFDSSALLPSTLKGIPHPGDSSKPATIKKSVHISPLVPPSFKATYLHHPPPVYPLIAKRRGQEGKVILKVKVNQSGQAEHVQVDQSSGYPILDEAALQAVKQWQFTPATRAGQTIDAWVQVPIVFQLK